MRFKLGRKPRLFDPRVPHMRALLKGVELPPPPASVDYDSVLPADIGMLMNSDLGDCTCAAMLHAQQVWSANANPPMVTVDDDDALKAYEGACGYNPADASTDQGGDEQTVLTYWLNNPVGANTLTAFVEVAVANLDNIKRAIVDSGVCYLGFNVPAFLRDFEDGGSTWDVDATADNSIVGGHAVIADAYDDATKLFKIRSWGMVFYMSYAFFAQFVDEAYALADAEWIAATGLSPGGLSIETLEAAMTALKK